MKISIVIPNYNTGKYLSRCLESIFRQSYKDFEVIVIDAYSKDNSRRVLEDYYQAYSGKMHIAYRQPQGQSDAINAGLEIASGDIVTYICADDTYEPRCFEKVIKCFSKHPNTNWVYGRGKIIDDGNREVRSFITNSKRSLQHMYSYNTLRCVDYIVQPTVFMQREFLKQVGEFNRSLRYVMDYEYWLRAGQVSSPKFINKHLANWRAHSGSLTEREHKAEAKQALEVQSWYSPWYYRPIQWLVYIVTVTLYGGWIRK